MQTVNISLPESLAQQVSGLISQGEYASRSEVFRTALRLFLALEKAESPLIFSQFVRRPLSEIESGLSEAGYKPEFVQSVTNGLKKSSLYRNK